MISLFINHLNWRYKQRTAPDLNNIYNRISTYVKSVVSYFHRSNYMVLNNNILVQIIKQMDIDYNWSDINIVTHVNNNARGILRTLGISSELYIDVLSANNTIIKNALEIIYMNNKTNLTNYNLINRDTWTTIAPIVFRNHDFRDLYGNHPDRIILNKKSLVIYDLDIVSLILMYKYYALDRTSRGLHESISEFVGSYVLSNSIHSMIDISILNNYLNKGDIENSPKQFVSTTSVPILEAKLDLNVIDKSIMNYERQSIMEILTNIKLISKDNAYEALYMSNFYETSRSKIYLALVTLDFINSLLDFIDVESRDNGAYMKLLKYDLNVLNSIAVNTSNPIVNNKYRKLIKDIGSKI